MIALVIVVSMEEAMLLNLPRDYGTYGYDIRTV